MNIFEAERLSAIKEYIPEDTHYTIRMDANESFISLPSNILDAFSAAVLSLDYNRYPDPFATKVCARMAEYLGVPPDTITAGNGSDELISLLLGVLPGTHKKILMSAPDFAMYQFYAAAAEQEIITYGKDSPDFTLPVSQLLALAKKERPDVLIFSNPCSPTGQLMTREDITELLSALPCTIVVDEAYGDFAGQSVLDLVGQYKNLVVLKTASKAIGLAALRLGFAVTHKENTRVLRKIKSIYNVNTLTQTLGELVLSDTAYLKKAKEQILESCEMLYQGLCKIAERFPGFTVLKSAANFVFVRPRDAKTMQEALKKDGICVRLMGGYLRITCAKPEENAIVLERMAALCELQK